MTIWFTSDTHFSHVNILKYCDRPFNSVQHMNEELVARWNEVVAPDDTVYHLGDVAMGNLPETLQIVLQLNGTKLLIPGNHDACFPHHRKYQHYNSLYKEVGFTVLSLEEVFTYNGCRFKLSHVPIPKGDCDFLLHGHTHSSEKMHQRSIHVGVEAWNYYPVSLQEIFTKLITGAEGTISNER